MAEIDESRVIYRSKNLIILSSGKTATEEEKRQRLAKYIFCLYEIEKELKSGKKSQINLEQSKTKKAKRTKKSVEVAQQTA